jgi:predicted polyphosphate/ATP-dependent NAD kinase
MGNKLYHSYILQNVSSFVLRFYKITYSRPSSSGKMKREMPPVLRWTLKKLERRLSGLFKPKITEDDVIEEVKKKCDKEKIKLDIEFTKYPKHATKLAEAAKDKYDLIIAAGGDGTINEVINGMANSKVNLVIIPFGSTNVFIEIFILKYL